MLYRALVFSLAFGLAAGYSAVSNAVTLEYEQSQLSSNRYQFYYYLTNDADSFDLETLTIFFASNQYSNLQIINSPDFWDPLVAEPDPFFGDGYTDWYAISGSVAPGSTLNGFNVEADWIGTENTPVEGQYYEIYDANTFTTLASGTSRFLKNTPDDGDVATVPEINASAATTALALIFGLIIFVLERSRIFQRGNQPSIA